jgi:hypothetical protein
MRAHLEVGYLTGDKPEGWLEVYFLGSKERQLLWELHCDAILSAWIARHPGKRPWGWWMFEATEPRRCVVGVELLMPTREPSDWGWVWRRDFGRPAFLQCRPRGHLGLPAVESQAAYLDRLGLLGVEERGGLAANAFDDETANPFIVDAEEIDRLVAGDRQSSQRGLGGPGLRSSNLPEGNHQ